MNYELAAGGRAPSMTILHWTRRLNLALRLSLSIALVRHMEETSHGERLTH